MGAEAKFRAMFPKDEHKVLVILGGWTGLIGLGKVVFGGGKKADAQAPPPFPAPATVFGEK